MDNVANIAQNIFVQQLHGTLMGQPVLGQQFNQELMTDMIVATWEVSNGAKLIYPLPFGVLANIQPMNFNKAKLVAQFAPGFFDTPSAPVFTEVCASEKDINEYICSATVCKKVVPVGDALQTGSTIWDCDITPIDPTHGLRVTVKNPVMATLPTDEFDENFNQTVLVSRKLVSTKGTSSITEASGTVTYVTYQAYKCGWWIERKETFPSSIAHSFTTQERFYWPPVLRELEFMSWTRRSQKDPDEEGGTYTFPRLFFNPEGYDGPCDTLVEISWSLSDVELPNHEPLLPSRIYYACPSFTLNCPECLHPDVNIRCDFGTADEEWFFAAGSTRTFLATNETEWPDMIVGKHVKQAYKGGYLVTKWTHYPPVHNTDNTPDWNGWPSAGVRPTVAVSSITGEPLKVTVTLDCELGVGDVLYYYSTELADNVDFVDAEVIYGPTTEVEFTTEIEYDTNYYCRTQACVMAQGERIAYITGYSNRLIFNEPTPPPP
jgi:hypothetical protein